MLLEKEASQALSKKRKLVHEEYGYHGESPSVRGLVDEVFSGLNDPGGIFISRDCN